MKLLTSWPWTSAERIESLVNMIEPMVRLVGDSVQVGHELSCRFGPSGVCPDRLLFEIDPTWMRTGHHAQLLMELSMPEAMKKDLQQDMRHAHQFLFAAEASSGGAELRTYLGFAQPGHPQQPGLVMRGFKWCHGRERVSNYWHVPVSAHTLAIQGEQQSRLPVHAGVVWSVLMQILNAALVNGQGLDMIEMWAVTEPTTPRGSVCLRLYETGLCVADVALALEQLVTIWPSCAVSFENVIRAMGPRPLGWLAAGIDSAGLPFMTVYCEAGNQDVRTLLEEAGVAYA